MPLRVHEILSTVMGESSLAGRPCTLLRLTGCPLRCSYCDTPQAFEGGEDRDVDDIVRHVLDAGSALVLVTGGEPLVQPDVFPLLSRLVQAGLEVCLETSGAVSIADVPELVKRILDVKSPGSGMLARNVWGNLDLLRPGDEVKFVLTDRTDYEWAREVLRSRPWPDGVGLLFGAAHGRLDSSDLCRWILEDRLAVRLNVPLHKLLGLP